MTMNRLQRRQQARAVKKNETNIPAVKLSYAHSDALVLIMFDQTTKALAFTPEQVDAHIANLVTIKEALAKHRAANA